MNKKEIYAYLQAQHIWHEITEHAAVYTMAGFADMDLPYPTGDAKNLFVRDDKRHCYCMITVHGEKRVDLRAFRHFFGLRPLHFASPEELYQLLGLQPGSVTPLGMLNDPQGRVQWFLDEALLQPPGIIGVHPNDNTATVWLKTQDLIQLLRAHGVTVTPVDLTSLTLPDQA